MNVDLEKTFAFSSILADQDATVWINVYEVRVKMQPATDNHQEYNTAYQRIKFWFDYVMQDSVFLHQDHEKISSWRGTNARCLDFPVRPVDQVIGMMLMSKLTAMVEGRIIIKQVSISSPADDFVWYTCSQDDSLHWFEDAGWWQEAAPTYATRYKKSKTSDKIITITKQNEWQVHNLDWVPLQSKSSSNISVLPPNSDRNE
jgi:hypothetical protein